ncbi:MAG: DNA polymerase IV [Firmicutes bacterium]|nr:DNA polymerase IV [Bacillota bacterium]
MSSKKRIILLADMESFYASAEVARNPSLSGKPVAVCGDPERRQGIILAATKEAKAYGIKTAMTVSEAKKLCPWITLVRPHMQDYINLSLAITKIFHRYTDRVLPYSIDEQFLDMSGCERIFGSAKEMARQIIKEILEKTKIRCRVGIGENPLQAKMACDRFAKKNKEGIFILSYDNYTKYTWPLPVRDLFGVGVRMERNLYRMGVRTIGHLAALPKETLVRRWGINGELLWLNAWGIDHSRIDPHSLKERKGVSHSLTLPRDYHKQKEIKVVLLEITEEVCRRARALGKAGSVVSVYCRGADFDYPSGFYRQKKLPELTAVTMDIYPSVIKLFDAHWDHQPVRAIGVALSGLQQLNELQLSLLEDKERKLKLSRTTDAVRQRFGVKGLFRASSLTAGGQLFARATKIGGHEA